MHEMSIKARELPSETYHGLGCRDHLQMSSSALLCLHLQGGVQWKQPHGDVQRRPIGDEDHVWQRTGGENNRSSSFGEVLPPLVQHEGVHQHPPRPHLELQRQKHSGGSMRQVRWNSMRWKFRWSNDCRYVGFHEYSEAEKVPNI